jgi:hypothetical protein
MVVVKCWESSLKATTPKDMNEKSEGGYVGNTKVQELVYSVINVPFTPWGSLGGLFIGTVRGFINIVQTTSNHLQSHTEYIVMGLLQ